MQKSGRIYFVDFGFSTITSGGERVYAHRAYRRSKLGVNKSLDLMMYLTSCFEDEMRAGRARGLKVHYLNVVRKLGGYECSDVAKFC